MDVFDAAGVGVSPDGQAQVGGEAEEDDQSRRHMTPSSRSGDGLPAVSQVVGTALRTAPGRWSLTVKASQTVLP